jgi:hypothetical protein
VYRWNIDIATATKATKAASQPFSLFWTPSSCSIISSARASASSLTSFAGACTLAVSSLITPPQKAESPASMLVGAFAARPLSRA